MNTANDLRTRLSAALKDAMRSRDQVAASALRSALGAIGNAEAVPADQPALAPGAGGPHFAGAVAGLGTTEAARRQLTPADLNVIMRAEISERERGAGVRGRRIRGPSRTTPPRSQRPKLDREWRWLN